jgi:hypothetical protein
MDLVVFFVSVIELIPFTTRMNEESDAHLFALMDALELSAATSRILCDGQ